MKSIISFVLISLAVSQYLFPFQCSQNSVQLTVDQPMEPITCTSNEIGNRVPRITPDLPAGLTYQLQQTWNGYTVTISGTPREGLNARTFYIGFNNWISTVDISVAAKPTYCSYGFDTMTLYTNVQMEPIPVHCDSAISSFTIEPALPQGMTMNPQTGYITGILTTYDDESTVYTVTATNTFGSVTTNFSFRARDQVEMSTRGMIGCYWKSITECKVPDFDFFYKNPAQLCQTVGTVHFTDNNVDNTWPGLDRRFVDYYSAYFYSYVNILVAGNYEFILSSDDGAILYIDDLDTPLITRDACRALSEDKRNKELQIGRHLIVIRFFEFNSWSSLYVKFGSPENGIKTDFINTNDLRVGGRGPTFISYGFIGGYVNTDTAVYMPELSSGAPTKWEITPALPNGMSINSGNGYISGRPSATSSATYTVTATGVNGAASTTIRVVVTDAPINGFRAKYYHVTDDKLCEYHMLTGNTIQLQQIDKWTQINTGKTAGNAIWSGAPSNFQSMFYMEWEGYVKMESIGNWKLRLTCADGCKLIGADEQELINHWGCHDYTSKESIFAVSKIGYHYMRIEYQQKDGDKGITFEWKAPNGFWQVVPADKIFYVPTGVLTYESERTHYYTNVEIKDNVPVLFGVNSLTNWKVHPALPTGMSISTSNGRISGTPSAPQVMSFYTVTATAGSQEEKTVIAFDVTSLDIPSGLVYHQKGSPVGAAVNLVPLRPIDAITISNPNGVTVSSYSISPALPEGLTLDPFSGTISGRPLVKLAQTPFTVTASNVAGSMLIMINLSVSGCQGPSNQWTSNFYRVTFLTGTGSVSVVDASGSVQQCSMDTMNEDGSAMSMACSKSYIVAGGYSNSASICMNPADAAGKKIKVVCNDDAGCRWQISRDDGHYFPYRTAYTDLGYAPYTDEVAYPTTLTPLTKLTLGKTTVTAYSGSVLESISVTPDGAYKSITITPPLGDITIDPTYPILSGTPVGTGSKTYSITALGDSGTASANLQVNFAECDIASGKRSITFKKITKAIGEEESWRLLKGNDELYNSGRLAAFMVYSVTLCLDPDTYTIELMDTYKDGWKPGAFLQIYDDHDNLMQSYLMQSSGLDKETKIFVLEPSIKAIEWKALIDKKPESKWKEIGFDASDWTTVKNGNVGTWSQNGIYFIHQFNLEDGDAYPIVEFGIYYKDGCIVYLNGEVVYNRNMPSSSVNHKTPATSSFDGALIRIGTAPGYLLKTGANVLAVELHRVPSVQGPISWSGYVTYTAGDCVKRSVGGTITESQFYDKAGETAHQAWDDDEYTQWTENGLPAWTVYSYDFDHVEWINRISITSNRDDSGRDPAEFSVYGSNDGVNWDRIFNYEKRIMFNDRRETKSWMMMDHMNSYGKYKFEINKSSNNVAQVSVSTIALEACRLVYCPKEGDYPGTLAGERVTIDCAEGFLGERYRECGKAALKPEWGEADETECRAQFPSSKEIAYIDTIYVLSPVVYSSFFDPAYIEAMKTVIAEIAAVEAKSIEIWKAKDVSESFKHEEMGDDIKTAIWVRITVSNDVASDVLTKMGASLAPLRDLLLKYYADKFSEKLIVTFFTLPALNQFKGLGKVNGWVIALLVITVLIIGSIVGFFIWTRTKNKKTKNGAKKLSKAKQSKGTKDTKSKKARV